MYNTYYDAPIIYDTKRVCVREADTSHKLYISQVFIASPSLHKVKYKY